MNIISDADVSAAFHEAATFLGVQITAPFEFAVNGRKHRCIAFLPHFSHAAGILVAGTSLPEFATDAALMEDAATLGYGVSFVNRDDFQRFEAEPFMDMFREWGYTGPENGRPAWF